MQIQVLQQYRLVLDRSVNYLYDASLVPYKQLSQTYWAQWGSRWFHQKLGFNARYTCNSARSGMNPDLNPNNAAQLGNAGLIAQGVFDPVLFGGPCPPGQVCSALAELQLASTQISQVIVPQNIGEAKIYYLFPRKFNAGLLFILRKLSRRLESQPERGSAHL